MSSTLILGAGGMLGTALCREAAPEEPLMALSRAELDIRDRRAVEERVTAARPEAIVNCAAMTAVDACEERRDEAFAVNGEAVGHLAAAARDCGALLVQVSTDFVFDGAQSTPYREDDTPNPLSVYGRSKLEGEHRALEWEESLVVRTSWIFGPGGTNFVATMARLIREDRKPLRVVADQVGCPTYSLYLARAIWQLVGLRSKGIVHYRNREPISWHGFASSIAALLDDADEVEPISSEELARLAPRPRYSVLDVSRFERLARRTVEPWSAGLEEYLDREDDGNDR
ncbi:MAG: dTDP-4-dehydrorhamnose reductase [Thermoanaerobaculia bacterium]|nr:dTDP-4-dehydrorhamnose reductase [Thermoanaerobaculia bacterium]